MKNSQFTPAGKLSNGRTVYFGKKCSADPTERDLDFWVSINPKDGTGADYLRLGNLGFDEEARFLTDYPADLPPWEARAKHRAAYFVAVAAFLHALPPYVYTAHSNAAILESMGEPFPDVTACLAAGQDPYMLAMTTGRAIAEIRECETLTA